jgi:hypothetical protein
MSLEFSSIYTECAAPGSQCPKVAAVIKMAYTIEQRVFKKILSVSQDWIVILETPCVSQFPG